MVGSVPHRGIRKIAGTTAASANGPLLQGRPELLNLEERKLVFGSGDGDNGGVGWPNLEGRMSETLPMEGTGAMIPSRKLYTETVGAARPIKRLVEFGSLSILSPAASVTTT